MEFMDMIVKKIARTGDCARTKNMAESVKLSSMVTDEERKYVNCFQK